MIFSPETVTPIAEPIKKLQLQFPSGLIGFPGFTSAELIVQTDQHPFMWLNGTGEEKLSFIVLEPSGVMAGYEIEVAERDAEGLGLTSPQDAKILNIATVQEGPTTRITLNLIGPIIINTKTNVARQIVISNSQNYSAKHVLFESKEGK